MISAVAALFIVLPTAQALGDIFGGDPLWASSPTTQLEEFGDYFEDGYGDYDLEKAYSFTPTLGEVDASYSPNLEAVDTSYAPSPSAPSWTMPEVDFGGVFDTFFSGSSGSGSYQPPPLDAPQPAAGFTPNLEEVDAYIGGDAWAPSYAGSDDTGDTVSPTYDTAPLYEVDYNLAYEDSGGGEEIHVLEPQTFSEEFENFKAMRDSQEEEKGSEVFRSPTTGGEAASSESVKPQDHSEEFEAFHAMRESQEDKNGTQGVHFTKFGEDFESPEEVYCNSNCDHCVAAPGAAEKGYTDESCTQCTSGGLSFARPQCKPEKIINCFCRMNVEESLDPATVVHFGG